MKVGAAKGASFLKSMMIRTQQFIVSGKSIGKLSKKSTRGDAVRNLFLSILARDCEQPTGYNSIKNKLREI